MHRNPLRYFKERALLNEKNDMRYPNPMTSKHFPTHTSPGGFLEAY